MADLIGKRFANYQVVALLGEGGMATVYQAQHIAMKRDVALKVIKPELDDTDEFMKRFEREAQTIASLSHPHILKIFEYGQYKKTPFLAMELLTGGSLAGLIRRGALPLDSASRIFAQTCSALDYAHNLGIVHRDLKPQNVMLDANGNAILTDFGLAKLLTDSGRSVLTQSGAQMGTPAYMSPEQWRADPIDARADIYALGALLFEMLTGTPVFKAESAYDLMHKHLYVAPPLIRKIRPELPAALEQVVRRMLAKDREERYLSVNATLEAFQSAVSPVSSVAVPPALTQDDDPETLTISPSQAAAQEREAIAHLEAERGSPPRSTPTTSTRRFIGVLPQDVGDHYVGRGKQVADIANLLIERTRLVSIYGRSGVGKTALACKVLADLAAGQNVDAIVCLSAASGTARLDRVLTDFGRALGGDDRLLLEGVSRDGQIPIAQKAAVLLEKLRDGRYILLLDNLETVQDPATGALTDPDLQIFLEAVLEQGGSLRILITSREPLMLPRPLKTWERLVPLDEGLPVEEAIALLRASDPDGAAGLRDAPDDSLRQVAQKTDGYPRALEAVAGLLLDDPLLSLDALLHDLALLTGEITPIIVQQAIERLSPDAVRVMQALALFGRPVSQAALEFLLSLYMDTSGLRNILARLVRAYFVNFNRSTQQFSLHPIDQEYCYQQISTAAEEAFNRTLLHQRAAEYYVRQRKPQIEWTSVESLTPQLAEFDHLVAAGEYNEAARLLLAIDKDYLWDWGQQALLAERHGRLRGRITDERLAHQNLRRIAWTRFWANTDEAAKLFQQLLEDARNTGDRQAEADALDDLAQIHRRGMDIPTGFQLHQQALEIYREIGDRRGQAEALGGMGASVAFAYPEIAIGYLQEALAIQRDLDNRHSLAFVLLSLGQTALNDLEQYGQAVAYLEQALTLAREINNSQTLVQGLVVLGEAYAFQGNYERAMGYYQESITTAERASGEAFNYGYAFATSQMAQAQALKGDLDVGIQTLRQFLDVPGNLDTPFAGLVRTTLSVLLAVSGEVRESRQISESVLRIPLPAIFRIYPALVLTRAGERDATNRIFEKIVASVQQMSPRMLPGIRAEGLALSAIAVLTGDSAKVKEAVEVYRRLGKPPELIGFRQFQRMLLDMLMECPGGDVLAPVRAVLVD